MAEIAEIYSIISRSTVRPICVSQDHSHRDTTRSGRLQPPAIKQFVTHLVKEGEQNSINALHS